MKQTWLVYGGRGWIGTQLQGFISRQYPEDTVVVATARADNYLAVLDEIHQHGPSFVFSCVGRTHGPNCGTIDYLEGEGKLVENVRDNLLAPFVLGVACQSAGVHFTYLGTGCIFESRYSTDGSPQNSFGQDAMPNFFGSSYSTVKGVTDRMMHLPAFPVLNVRIRMPISGSPHPRNFITKIASYDKVVNIQNSMTVIDTLFPYLLTQIKEKRLGTINLTNPGTISHNEILDMYKEIVDPAFTYNNFSLEEQALVLASGRSNNELQTTFPDRVPHIQVAVRMALEKYKLAFYRPSCVLITGGLGFIGSHVLTYLYRKYPTYRFVNVDCGAAASHRKNIPNDIACDQSRYTLLEIDIRDRTKIEDAIVTYSVDTIMHFAAESHVDNSFNNSLVFTETNVVGTHTMLQATLNTLPRIQRFIHVSTDEVYGEAEYSSDTHMIGERTAHNPTNPYAASKVGAEAQVKAYLHSFKLPCIITRGNNVYGPGQYPEKVIPKFACMAHRGLAIPLHGDGSSHRSFMHVTDVAKAFDVVLHRGNVGSVYNVGTDEEYLIADVASMIRDLVPNCKSTITSVADRKFNDKRYYISSTELQKLGWTPKIKFKDGLVSTVAWYVENASGWWGEDILKQVLQPHPM